MKIRHTLAAIAVAAVTGLAVIPAVVAAGNGNEHASYRVTIENLTTGQPLSPAGAVVHARSTEVWSVGAPASAAVAAVAEDANLPVFVATYTQAAGVSAAFPGGGVIPPLASGSFEFDADPGQRLSLISMLVNTNDAFTGLDAVRLGGDSQVFEVGAYDAGTEVNDERASHIPGPAGGHPFVRQPEGGLIAHHAGVLGVGDLDPAVYGWSDPVARITVERVG